MTKKKDELDTAEFNFTFECVFTEKSRIEKRIRTQCFERSLLVDNFKSLGGFVKDCAYGVKVQGTSESVEEFKSWWMSHEKDLCDTRSVVGAFIRDNL